MSQPQLQPRSDELAQQREALEDMLQSEGWRIFEGHIAQEWQGIGYYVRMNQILESPKPEEAVLVNKCSKAITTAVTWPKRRVAELTEAK